LISFVLPEKSIVLQQIESIIKDLKPIQLDEAEKVKLFDRIDIKYIFHINYLAEILKNLSGEYRILEVQGIRNQFYRSLYFDTGNYQLYFAHHNGHLNRYKVRFREYASTRTCFLEIKFKSNQDRTLKKRSVANEMLSNLTDTQELFLKDNIPYSRAVLEAQTWTNFNRISLIHKEKAERVTIDTRPQWIFSGKELLLSALVIAEVKRDKMAWSSFANLLRQRHIHENGFSKYCIGTALLGPGLKSNLFKPTLLSIKKICKNELPDFPSTTN
jgi:hypothetical protein